MTIRPACRSRSPTERLLALLLGEAERIQERIGLDLDLIVVVIWTTPGALRQSLFVDRQHRAACEDRPARSRAR